MNADMLLVRYQGESPLVQIQALTNFVQSAREGSEAGTILVEPNPMRRADAVMIAIKELDANLIVEFAPEVVAS